MQSAAEGLDIVGKAQTMSVGRHWQPYGSPRTYHERRDDSSALTRRTLPAPYLTPSSFIAFSSVWMALMACGIGLSCMLPPISTHEQAHLIMHGHCLHGLRGLSPLIIHSGRLFHMLVLDWLEQFRARMDEAILTPACLRLAIWEGTAPYLHKPFGGLLGARAVGVAAPRPAYG